MEGGHGFETGPREQSAQARLGKGHDVVAPVQAVFEISVNGQRIEARDPHEAVTTGKNCAGELTQRLEGPGQVFEYVVHDHEIELWLRGYSSKLLVPRECHVIGGLQTVGIPPVVVE